MKRLSVFALLIPIVLLSGCARRYVTYTDAAEKIEQEKQRVKKTAPVAPEQAAIYRNQIKANFQQILEEAPAHPEWIVAEHVRIEDVDRRGIADRKKAAAAATDVEPMVIVSAVVTARITKDYELWWYQHRSGNTVWRITAIFSPDGQFVRFRSSALATVVGE